jgi:hypothetical protein
MKNDDIKTGTRVHHPEGGEYCIQRLSMNGSGGILTLAIGKSTTATAVFDGHPDEARRHGFMFGDEEWPGVIAEGTIITHTAYPDRLYGYEPLEVVGLNAERTYRILREGASISTGTVAELYGAGFRFNAPEVTVEEIEALLTPEEPEPSAMRRAWLASEEAVRALTETIESREADITNLKEELVSAIEDYRLRAQRVEALEAQVATLEREKKNASETASSWLTRAQRAEVNLDEFKVQVRDQVAAAKKEHDLCLDGCNSFLEELGLPMLQKKYTVTVTRDSDGETILTVSDIEADSESEAKSEVRDNFTVTATVKEVRFDYEYDGEGEADFDSDDYTDDDFDVTDDEYADSHRDNLTFTVEED